MYVVSSRSYLASHTAHAGSSNYNCPPGSASGFDPIQRALAIVQAEGSKSSELEVDLIEAMATRSSAESKAAFNPREMNFGEFFEVPRHAIEPGFLRGCAANVRAT